MIKHYDRYKQSGIEWIGKFPNHWSKVKIGRSFNKIGSGTTPKSGNDVYYENGNINWLNTGDLNDSYITETNKKITEAALREFSTLKLYPKNSIVIALYGATIGKLGQLKIETTTNQACCVLSDSDDIENRYLFYFLLSAREYIISKAYGGGQPNISQDLIKQLYISAPAKAEQSQIIQYLDHQTSIIDQLIQQKEKLIALLKEKRQSVINEAVTKGLNPNAKMKDSGIEWLGEIPNEWNMKRLRYLGKCQNGVSQGSDYFGSGDPFVSYGDVYKNMTLPFEVTGLAKSTESDKESYSVLEGDVFFTRTSETIEEIGFASTCLRTIENAVFAGFLIRFRPIPNVIDRHFSKYYFRSHIPRIFFIKEMNLVTRASLSQELLKSLPVLLPGLNEQKQIAAFLDRKIAEFDTLIINIANAVLKLKEYRQSIISEAVTGKIDLREWQANKQQIP